MEKNKDLDKNSKIESTLDDLYVGENLSVIETSQHDKGHETFLVKDKEKNKYYLGYLDIQKWSKKSSEYKISLSDFDFDFDEEIMRGALSCLEGIVSEEKLKQYYKIRKEMNEAMSRINLK